MHLPVDRGRTDKDTEIGEMHALITLDNGEVRRAIIPEAIAIPQGMANSYLLAATPSLIAGHKYSCVISKPKLHFKGGGTTLSISLQLTPINKPRTNHYYSTAESPTIPLPFTTA